jgi:hypothetical protein
MYNLNKQRKTTQMNNIPKHKTLTNEAMIRNINGLSVGQRAYCGPYGTVTCTKAASEWRPNAAVPRKFSVSGSLKLVNRGNYTMKQLRKAICG